MSAFLKMARTVEEELIAGRINAYTAKCQLHINEPIAEELELLDQSDQLKRFAHTKGDWERDKKLNENFYMWAFR